MILKKRKKEKKKKRRNSVPLTLISKRIKIKLYLIEFTDLYLKYRKADAWLMYLIISEILKYSLSALLK